MVTKRVGEVKSTNTVLTRLNNTVLTRLNNTVLTRLKHKGSPGYKSLRQPQINNWHSNETFVKSFLSGVNPMVSNSCITLNVANT